MSSPPVYDPIGTLSMICPPTIGTNDIVFCDITLSSGSNLEVTIDYGDGSKDVFNPAGNLYKGLN